MFIEQVGSEFWMAPEVHQGGKPTSASDVFSFSVVMWEVNGSSRSPLLKTLHVTPFVPPMLIAYPSPELLSA